MINKKNLNIKETLEELYSLSATGIKLGLDNIREILDLMGNPQDSYKIVHIAGTNGKGSTASIVETSLIEANYKVGKYTSPHIVDFNERIVVDKKQISNEDICSYYSEIMALIEDKEVEPTFFEITTAIMFQYFKDCQCEYVVLETGLGGRFDATNVCKPEISIITNISLDHTNILGDNLEAIALEKCGIIKDKPVIIADSKKELLEAVKAKTDDYVDVLKKYKDVKFRLLDNFYTEIILNDEIYELSLYGEYQVNNFLGGYEALKMLGVSNEVIKKASKKVIWPGRFEIYNRENPLIILDGAHNVDAAFRLKNNILSKYKKDEVISVVGILGDKDRAGILDEISKFSNEVIFTSLLDFHRGTSGDELLDINLNFKKQSVENDLEKAISMGINSNKVIVVCGSFYLLSKFKQVMVTRSKLDD